MSDDSGELLERLRPLFATRRTPVYLVGGAVRDALLGRPAYDLDFVVAEGAISLAFTVADALRVAAYALDRERDIGRVVIDAGTILDFARFRGPDLEADLRARDFTINALAIEAVAAVEAMGSAVAPDTSNIIDPTGGLPDLHNRILRQTNPQAIDADPIRALRAVRLAWQLGFSVEPYTVNAARAASSRLLESSAERIRDEFLKILAGPAPHHALHQMQDWNLLDVVLPEIAALHTVEQSAPHHEPVLAHTHSVLRYLLQIEAALQDPPAASGLAQQTIAQPSPAELLGPYATELQAHLNRPVDGAIDGRIILRLGALFHDAGKATTASLDEDGRIRFFGHDEAGAKLAARRLRALRFSNDAARQVRTVVGAHMRPLHLANSLPASNTISRRAAYRFFRSTGDVGLDVVLLSLADHLATYDGAGPPAAWQAITAVAGQLLAHYFTRFEQTVAPPPLLQGGELIAEFNLKPGPQIGRLLRLIEEAQAAGEIGSKEEALALAKKELANGA